MFWDIFNLLIHTNPALSSVDKLNYLISLVDSSAVKAIAGLSVTSKYYDEAVTTRFGNPQLIVNRHMEALLSVADVSSHLNIKGLQKLCDTVEAQSRGLRAFGVPAETYGGPPTPFLVSKLPPEICLIVSRETIEERWSLDGLMKNIEREVDDVEREVDARQHASSKGTPITPHQVQTRTSTAAALVASNSQPPVSTPRCVYYG